MMRWGFILLNLTRKIGLPLIFILMGMRYTVSFVGTGGFIQVNMEGRTGHTAVPGTGPGGQNGFTLYTLVFSNNAPADPVPVNI